MSIVRPRYPVMEALLQVDLQSQQTSLTLTVVGGSLMFVGLDYKSHISRKLMIKPERKIGGKRVDVCL